MRKPRHPHLILAVAAASLCLASCGTPEAYYRLSAEGPAPAHAAADPALGVGPIDLPEYINRPELVFQSGPNRFEVPYGHRWAGSLAEAATQALAANLARRLGNGNVHPYPWAPGTALDRQVIVDIRQFHAVTGGDAILEAAWQIRDLNHGAGSGALAAGGSGRFDEPLAEGGYDAVVAAQSRLISRLADAIAADFSGR